MLAGFGLLFAGCSKSQTPLQKAGITIISATYGSGTSYVEVTSRVITLLNKSYSGFSANPRDLGEDPTPGWNKALIIDYEFASRRHVMTTGENGRVDIVMLRDDAKK